MTDREIAIFETIQNRMELTVRETFPLCDYLSITRCAPDKRPIRYVVVVGIKDGREFEGWHVDLAGAFETAYEQAKKAIG